MKVRNEDTLPTLRRLESEGLGYEKLTLRQTMHTTLGAHSQPGQVRLQLMRSGIKCELLTSGSWFAKTHLLIIDCTVHEAIPVLEFFKQVGS